MSLKSTVRKAVQRTGAYIAEFGWTHQPLRWLMEAGIALLIRTMPGLLVTWVYPWIAQPMLVQYVGGLPNATFICQKLVDSFTSPPASIDPNTTVPELAFALTVEQLLRVQGLNLSAADLGPLMVGIGARGLADPSLAEPAP